MRGFKTLNNHNTKIAGMITVGAGIIITIIQKLTHFSLTAKLSAEQSYYLCLWVVIFGMYMTAFSQEKVEDERVKKIRSGTVQIVIMLLMGMLMSLSLVGTTANMEWPSEMLMFIAGFYLLAYLILFNIGLRFDNLWNYNADDISIKENFKKNSWVHLVTVIVAIILITLVMKLF